MRFAVGWARAAHAFRRVAIRQENIKRMLAYTRATCSSARRRRASVYLVAYVGTTLGAFTVASWVGRKGDECQNVDDWAGLARGRPAIALVMTLFMLSLAGFPPTDGFFAKFYLFRAAVERPYGRAVTSRPILGHGHKREIRYDTQYSAAPNSRLAH
jgi:NADH:ubiquinone oxidoreductase subunit 2 (subunit N)